jgi:hypothetical protein
MVNGYVRLYEPENPNSNKSGEVLEHVKVMAGLLGRPLTDNEVVHHRNGVRSDNRPENLELWFSKYHPHGQRVEDRVRDALDIIAKYPDVVSKVKEELAAEKSKNNTEGVHE